MNTKAIDPEIDACIERNREKLNEALEAGYASLEKGNGIAICRLEDLLLALSTAQASRRH
jgi:hypothetical protein